MSEPRYPDEEVVPVKDALVREFAERIDRLSLAADIGLDDARCIVDGLIQEMRRMRLLA